MDPVACSFMDSLWTPGESEEAWFLVALVHQKVGRTEEARKWLARSADEKTMAIRNRVWKVHFQARFPFVKG
jgi:hypothetical protein